MKHLCNTSPGLCGRGATHKRPSDPKPWGNVARQSESRRNRTLIAVSPSWSSASSPKTGLVGPDRFETDSIPGTYFGGQQSIAVPARTVVEFDIGNSDMVRVTVPVGSNMLRAAEQAGVMTATREFCFEGSCELCQCAVVGGAQELGKKAHSGMQELVRSCLTAVPDTNGSSLCVQVLSQEEVWDDMVV